MQSVLINKYILLDIIWFDASQHKRPSKNNAYAHIWLHEERRCAEFTNAIMQTHGVKLLTTGTVDEMTNKRLFMMLAARIYIYNNINN